MSAATDCAGVTLDLRPNPVFDSLDELLEGAVDRRPYLTTDSKSGSGFERVTIDGSPHVLKHIHVDDDWTIRCLGDIRTRALAVWETGLVDLVPDQIDHAMVGAARGQGRNGWGAALLMRDVEAWLVPAGDDPVTLSQHRELLDRCACLAARAWGWHDDIGLTPYPARFQMFSDAMIKTEQALGYPNVVPRIAGDGWQRFTERVPSALADLVLALRDDVDPLVAALQATPSTFLHGDWKMGNLGRAADGRTILIDWSYPGEGPICHELGWYLALNAARIPESKAEAIAAFRGSLEGHGIRTDEWWDRQLALCLLGTFVQFGWEKAFGTDEELGWWMDRAREGSALL